MPEKMKMDKPDRETIAKEIYVLFFSKFVTWEDLSLETLQKFYEILIDDICYKPRSETCAICGREIPEGMQVCPNH